MKCSYCGDETTSMLPIGWGFYVNGAVNCFACLKEADKDNFPRANIQANELNLRFQEWKNAQQIA